MQFGKWKYGRDKFGRPTKSLLVGKIQDQARHIQELRTMLNDIKVVADYQIDAHTEGDVAYHLLLEDCKALKVISDTASDALADMNRKEA